MFVEGFVIDHVRERRPYAADGIVLNEWLAAVGWSDQSQLPPDPFWRTLVADRGPKGLNPPTFYPRASKSALNQSVKGGHVSTNSRIHYGTITVAKFGLSSRKKPKSVISSASSIVAACLLCSGKWKGQGRMRSTSNSWGNATSTDS